jgi:8-oxo-dGTP diphosphatase
MNSYFSTDGISKQIPHPPRVRVCGLLFQNDTVLLLKHRGIGKEGYIWSPPGGGIDPGENVTTSLIREFKEETNLTVEIERFMFVNEYVDTRFHAIELFFTVRYISGELILGRDPEFEAGKQILVDTRFMNWNDLQKIESGKKHNIFGECSTLEGLQNLQGFYYFVNI